MNLRNNILSIAAISLGLASQTTAAPVATTIHAQVTLKAHSPRHEAITESTLGPKVSLLGGFTFRPPKGLEYGLRTMSYTKTIAQGYVWEGPKRPDGTYEMLLVIVAVPLQGYYMAPTSTTTSDFINVMLRPSQSDPAFYHSDMSEIMINDLPFLREYYRASAHNDNPGDGAPSASPMNFASPTHLQNIDEPGRAMPPAPPNGSGNTQVTSPPESIAPQSVPGTQVAPSPQGVAPAPPASTALVHMFIYACTTPKGIISFIGADSEPYNKTTLAKLEASVLTVKNPAY